VIDEILELLERPGGCSLREVSEKSGLSESDIEIVLKFLVRYDFVMLAEGGRRARLTPVMARFLRGVRGGEEAGTGP